MTVRSPSAFPLPVYSPELTRAIATFLSPRTRAWVSTLPTMYTASVRVWVPVILMESRWSRESPLRVLSIIVVDPPVTVTDAFVPFSVLSAGGAFLVTSHSPSTDPSVHVLVLHNCTPNVSSAPVSRKFLTAVNSKLIRPDLSGFTCVPTALALLLA